MPSTDDVRRRRFLGSLGTALFALGGCLSQRGPASTDPTETPWTTTPDPATPTEEAAQPAGWPLDLDGNVLAVDADDGELFALVGGGSTTDSRLVALAADGSVRWSSAFEANEHGSGPDEPEVGDDGWSTWLTDDSVYLAAGVRHEWWAVRAFDRADGTERWSFRTDRRLRIHAVTDDSLLVTAEEIFVPEHSHDTPEEPLTSELYRLDRSSGEATALGTLGGVVAATVADGESYAIADGRLVALDGSGGQRWSYSLPGPGVELFPGPDGVVAVAKNSGLTGGGNRVIGVGPDGERRWRHDVPEANQADVVLADDVVYVGGGEGVAAVRLDGTLAWRDDRPGGWPVVDSSTGWLYTRSGKRAASATAYAPGGGRRWTFEPGSRDAWPATVTDDAVLVTAITGEHASEPGYTVYAVDPETGRGGALTQLDTIFAAEPVGSRVYFAAGSEVHAFEPSPGR